MPSSPEVHLHPGREIHRRIRWRQADIADIARAVSRWNVEAPAEGDRQMSEVSANALRNRVRLVGRSCRAGVLVAERDVRMNEIADRLYAVPSERCGSEKTPRLIGEPVGFAVAAAEEELQRL